MMLRVDSKPHLLPFPDLERTHIETLKLKYKTSREKKTNPKLVESTPPNSVCCKINDDHTVFIIWEVLFDFCS